MLPSWTKQQLIIINNGLSCDIQRILGTSLPSSYQKGGNRLLRSCMLNKEKVQTKWLLRSVCWPLCAIFVSAFVYTGDFSFKRGLVPYSVEVGTRIDLTGRPVFRVPLLILSLRMSIKLEKKKKKYKRVVERVSGDSLLKTNEVHIDKTEINHIISPSLCAMSP